MTACPVCGSEEIRVGWPEDGLIRLIIPLTCKRCGHQWRRWHLPLPIEGERADNEEAEA